MGTGITWEVSAPSAQYSKSKIESAPKIPPDQTHIKNSGQPILI